MQRITVYTLFFICNILAADSASIAWAKIYGNRSDLSYGESVDLTSDGGYIVTGYIDRFKNSNSKSLTYNNPVYLIRTDSNGDTLWTREYAVGVTSGKYYSVMQTADGGFIASGYFWPSEYNADICLIKTDSNGDTLWVKAYGTVDGGEEGYSVDQTHDGGFVVAGRTTYICSFGNIYLMRTDSLGDTLWTKIYQRGDAHSVRQTKNKGFIVSGFSADTATNSDYQLFLMHIDSLGDTLWTKTYGDTGQAEIGYSVQQTSDDGFIVCGSKGVGRQDKIYLLRTDSYGDTLWTKIYNWGAAYSVDQTSDGGFIVAGTNGYFYVMRTDSEGNVLWDKSYGHPTPDQRAKSVKQTKDGGYIAAGWGRLEPDSTGIHFLLIKYDTLSTGIKKDNSPKLGTIKENNLFYNYKGNIISINYTILYSSNVKLEVYNTQGKLVKVLVDRYMNSGSYTVKWNTKRDRRILVAGGVYFLKLSANGHTVSKKVTIVK